MPARPAAALLLAVLCCLLTGCQSPSASGLDAPSSAPPSAGSLPGPAVGLPLSAFGLTNGPQGLGLPAGLVFSHVVDQANVVTVVLDADQGEVVHAFLLDNLAAMGFTIEASSGQSLVFADQAWQGALTAAEQTAALTLRRR